MDSTPLNENGTPFALDRDDLFDPISFSFKDDFSNEEVHHPFHDTSSSLIEKKGGLLNESGPLSFLLEELHKPPQDSSLGKAPQERPG